ncbi:MAG: hypothetical protein GYA24_18170, partial [Candidatus Lokiarchaeota archaeon]|nr:hypothetical protein [Candidatus Lokiarchaeota archaeon]
QSLTVRLDTIAPTTSISYTAAYTPNFVNTTTTFTLDASDNPGGSGLRARWYRINGGAWINYTGAFNVAAAGNGTVLIEYRSTDKVWNVEGIQSLTVRLDTIAPTTSISYTAAYTPNFVNTTTTFTLDANDNPGGSGLRARWYRINGGAWTNYSVPFTVAGQPNGSVLIEYRSTDKVWNVETTQSLTVRLDTIAPESTHSYVPHHLPNYVNLTTTFSLSSAENIGGSGLARIDYSIGADPWVAYSIPFTLLGKPNGTYTIRYRGIDKVGNIEIFKQFTVNLDIEGPTIFITSPENQTYGDTKISIVIGTSSPDYAASWYTITNVSSGMDIIINASWLAPVLVTLSNNSFRIRAWGNDTFGNVKQSISDVFFTIDISAPQVFLIKPMPIFYNITNVLVQLQNDSFVDDAKFRIWNGTTWSTNSSLTYNGTFWVYQSLNLGTGNYVIEVYAKRLSSREAKISRAFSVDMIAPTTSISYAAPGAPDFVNTTTTFTLSASDNAGGSGLRARWYRINSGTWTNYSAPFTVASAGNGTVLIEYFSTDKVWNIETTQLLTVRLDTIAPTTGISYTAPAAPDFVNTTTTFTLSASDNTGGSGIRARWYRLNGGAWTNYSAPFTVASAGNGTVLIEYFSTDKVWNVEGVQSITVRLDTISPATTITYSFHAPDYVGISGPTSTFSLSASDNAGGSGVYSIEYSFNGFIWVNYGGSPIPFTASLVTNGTITIHYRSRDNVGNLEAAGTRVVRIDGLAPTTGISYTPESGTNFVNKSTLFTLTASDNTGGSGVAFTQYRINAQAWINYTGPFNVSSGGNGIVSVAYRSQDNVQNLEIFETILVQLDTIAPTTSISYTAPGAPDFVNTTTTFTLDANDNPGGSGLRARWYRLNGGAWTNYSAPFTVAGQPNGSVVIEYFSTDKVWNVEDIQSITVRLDMIAPTTSISYTAPVAPNFVNTTTTFTLSASDNGGGSGIRARWYRINGGAWTNYSAPFTVASAGNGTVLVEYFATDKVWNAEGIQSITVRLDTIAPITNITFVPSSGIFFVNASTMFTLSASDNVGGSGIALVQYNINGTGWTTGTSFDLSGWLDGRIRITYRSIDRAGNGESAKTLDIYLGTSDPIVTTLVYSPAASPDIVINATQFVLVSSVLTTQYQQVTRRYYAVNGSSPTEYAGPFSLAGFASGTWNITFYAEDNCSNVEPVRSAIVRLDASAMPGAAITTVLTFIPAAATNIVTNGTSFTLSASVLSSLYQAITRVQYRINGSAWLEYSGPFNLTGLASGAWNIEFQAEDNCSNVESIKSVIVRLDADAPRVLGAISIPASVFKIGAIVRIRITCDGNDYVAMISITKRLLAPSSIHAVQG